MSELPKISSADLPIVVKTFIMRGSDRDKKVDRARIERLVEAIDTTVKEIITERDGLVERVKKTIAQPLAAAKKKISRRDYPTTNPIVELRRAEKRLDRLAKQKHDLESARALVLQWANLGET